MTPKALIRYASGNMRKDTSGSRLNSSKAFTVNRVDNNNNFETGLSATLGVDYKLNANNKVFDFSVAQIINEKENKKMSSESSLDEKLSDLVGAANLKINENINLTENKNFSFKKILKKYLNSDAYGNFFTFIQEDLNQFKLITIKNVIKDNSNIGYIVITENANDIKIATDERKAFVVRTAIAVGLVILIFSFVLSRYFIKPIQNLVSYTKVIKDKSQTKTNIESLKSRNDELGLLSNSLDDMTIELQKRVAHAENFSTDLVHEIRNPLASLKSASEILQDTNNSEQRLKLLNILSHDVLRIERLITDYSQMLKDEVALSKEKMEKINIEPIIQSVVDDYNNIQKVKKNIKINYENDGNEEYIINGIENRIEQIIANLLDNSISFCKEGENIFVNISNTVDKKILVKIIDDGQGFKEKDTSKIFKRFYSNRPDKFGEHSGLGLNIVKNLVDLHDGEIVASNRLDREGAIVEIKFPSV